MSDDEADPELLELLRQTLGIGRKKSTEITTNTGVLKDAEYIYNNAIDVSIDMYGTKGAAAEIHKWMQQKSYSTETWMENELHPRASQGFSENDIVNFIFTMDLLNFSFWSELSSEERYQAEYRGKRWTGYNSLVACLRRALDEGVPITTPRYWRSQGFSNDAAKEIFRSATAEQIPLLEERIAILKEAGRALLESFPGDGDDDEVPEHSMYDAEPHTGGTEYIKSLLPDDQSEQRARLELGEAADGTAIKPPRASTTGASQAISNEHPEIVAGFGEPREGTPPDAQDDARLTARAAGNDLPASQQGTAAQLSGPRTKSHTPDHAVARLIHRADKSAGKLVNLLAHHFPSFRDEVKFDGRKVRLLKRAQILVADQWAALNGTGLGEFHDIDHLTMFADYRVPQVLHSLRVLTYSPPLGYRIQNLGRIEPGHTWEVQLRGCSIWAVELIKREVLKAHPGVNVNAVLIDFFLYDLAKEREAQGVPSIPHHRTRSINY
ncbi:hypothetical protein DOTSEDRAFT_74309 [Dothistroma septosporum NZE10]|uniref:Queuosine 5'-phosphate N-glycosylase/hydrolase n=1 Tax=Dothistroma septosporum (strain NZE10 / CBS 128990) TaxID=675120 RepID=N1PDQ6_DOTSN|nr:hypothetical protein DOTSEDRAFT_74309 [Dothistroma septosporum NZE10]